MATVWIGDFRLKQLEYLQSSLDNTNDYSFLTDDAADYSWFKNNALLYLPKMYLDTADVVIMLGFIDCVYSCIWETFNIDTIANDYIKEINNIKNEYPDLNFYICSVNPIAADYPFAPYEATGLIPKSDINTKIKKFNNKIKAGIKTTFIDSHEYLTKTNFETRDGIRYTFNTCKALQNFIESKFTETVKESSSSNTKLKTVRDTPEKAPKSEEDSFIYWTHTSAGGLNTCVAVQNGIVLPNCTGYAWGRFYEISGEKPKLSTGNAGEWFLHNDGYKRGQEPKVGAVICWSVEGQPGHVGIVESYDPETGYIVTSESGYRTSNTVYDPSNATSKPSGSAHFWATQRYFKDGNWIPVGWQTGEVVGGKPYVFQGFIYNPVVADSGSGSNTHFTGDTITKANVTSNNASLSGRELENNARYIWQYFGSRGWTLNAVAAMLGNMERESTINPGRYENFGSSLTLSQNPTQSELNNYLETYKSLKGRYPGYGLVQWTDTGASRWSDHFYIKWCAENNYDPKDIDSALKRIEGEVEAAEQPGWGPLDQWITTSKWPIGFKEFTTSTRPTEDLAEAFLVNYERPGDVENNKNKRRELAAKWYNFLLPYAHDVVPESSQMPTAEPTFKVSTFKVDKITASSVEFSFLARKATKGSYSLDKGKSNDLTLKEGLNTFTIDTLKPNSKYKVKLELEGEGDNKFSEELSFEIPQAYPEPVRRIMLSRDLNVEIVKPSNFGYWEKNSKGYDIQLIVNGKCIDTVEETSIKGILKKKYNFNNYTNKKIDDVIQVGVAVWVKDDSGNKIYDTARYQSPMPKTSNTICLLSKPVSAYLNID